VGASRLWWKRFVEKVSLSLVTIFYPVSQITHQIWQALVSISTDFFVIFLAINIIILLKIVRLQRRR